jgi:AbrB family looped-hinge helix DNA binding protein
MKVGTHGQVTIPKELRRRYGLDSNVEVEFVPEEGGIKLRPKSRARHPVDRVRGIADLLVGKNVDDYIDQVRGK